MNIEIIFEEMKKKERNFQRASSLKEQDIADLFAAIEKYRLPVAFVFVPTKYVSELTAIIGSANLDSSVKAPNETAAIGYWGNFWGADWYVVDDLGAIYATSLYKFFGEDGAIAKLIVMK